MSARPVHVNLPLPPKLVDAVDAWRRPRAIDARTRAVRKLLEIALGYEKRQPLTPAELDAWYFEGCSDG